MKNTPHFEVSLLFNHELYRDRCRWWVQCFQLESILSQESSLRCRLGPVWCHTSLAIRRPYRSCNSTVYPLCYYYRKGK